MLMLRALLERPVEFDLADLAAQGRLRELNDGELVIGDAVGGALRIEHLDYSTPSTAT